VLREMAIGSTIDLSRGFSSACHDQFEDTRARHLESRTGQTIIADRLWRTNETNRSIGANRVS
jgi:hypothetical protein